VGSAGCAAPNAATVAAPALSPPTRAWACRASEARKASTAWSSGALQAAGGSGTTVARDLAHTGFPTARLDEPLADVLDRFDAFAAERLPVVEDGGAPTLAGTISKRDILAAYSVRLIDAERTPGVQSPPA